jgi:hypothetical protein
MSNETLQHLNTNTLIGNTDARGHAWHYRAEEQGTETNHYPGPIPVADVQRRLFNWVAESRRIAVEVPTGPDTMTHLSADGTPARRAVVDDKQAICRSDDSTGSVMGIFAPGYTRHQYAEWLLTTVANIDFVEGVAALSAIKPALTNEYRRCPSGHDLGIDVRDGVSPRSTDGQWSDRR